MERRHLVGISAAFVLMAATLFCGAAPASAHASLAGTEPEPSSSIEAAPAEVAVTFTENIGTSFLAVTAPDGSAVELGEVHVEGHTASAPLMENPGLRGVYTVSYRVVSADSHPVNGTFAFTVTSGDDPAAVSEKAPRVDHESFVHRHRSHIIWGVIAGFIAIVLMLAPLRKRDDA